MIPIIPYQKAGGKAEFASEKELRTLFSSVGAVTEVRVIVDRDTGQV